MEENPYILTTWKEIAKLTPYSAQTVRKKFGYELTKVLNIVAVTWVGYQDKDGKRKLKRVAVGSKYLLERYFQAKREKNEF